MQTIGPNEKPILLVNMDESSIKLCPQVKKGWVLADRRKLKSLLRHGRGGTLNDRRSSVTLVSFVCDSEEVQPLLPQVFLSNEHVLTKVDVKVLNSSSARNVLFSRRKSGWVNNSTLVETLTLLATCIGSFVRTHRVILFMDTCPAHLHVSVVQSCCRFGFLLMYIPASMTGWLQPLDVAVFGKYKEWVARELERKRVAAPEGLLSRVEVLGTYGAGVRAVMESQTWRRAFELTGLRGQSDISKRLLERLSFDAPPWVPATLPSAADLVAVYPRGANIPVDELFEGVLRLCMPQPRPRVRLRVKCKLPPALPPPAPPPAEVPSRRQWL